MKKIDVVVPVLNEADNLAELCNRLAFSLKKHEIAYRIIIIDDHSTDNTAQVVSELAKLYPIRYLLKQGNDGKAYSILQGTKISTSRYIAMIDGDLQYPPEIIPEMLQKAESENLGVVIGNRSTNKESKMRKFISRVGNIIYAKLLLGLSLDTQSGLKIFKREIVNHIEKRDIKPWAFDLPLLYNALEMGEQIGSVDISFEGRKNGVSKVNILQTSIQILETAIKLRVGKRKIFSINPTTSKNMMGAGVIYKKKKFTTHTTLHHSKSALIPVTLSQKMFIFIALLTLICGFWLNFKTTEILFIGFLSTIYFVDVFFSLFLVVKSLQKPPEINFSENELNNIEDSNLPIYTILSPLYKEAHILPNFVRNIENLDWPKEKLDVIILLEKDDTETIKAANNLNLPSYFRIIEVPDGKPKTKPKACNYGLSFAKGEYVVIYDAEDMPEPQQLKKAYLGFKTTDPKVFCLQAKLNYYNPTQNLLTRLFTAEYSLWFDLVLPGLQTIGTTIPLGGTSNHFRTQGLKALEGWDPFNVAEDADLGVRLFRAGYKTAIIDSITLEEANSDVKNWIRQRSRWLKGYIQTYFVQMRTPVKFAREQKWHYLIYQLVSGLRVSFMIINPIFWLMTAAYFLLNKYVGAQIEALYPPTVFYMAATSAVFGNFLYLYYYMIGAAKRGEWGIIKYVFLVPFYWLLTSIGAFMAFYQFIFKPHFWEKTTHGLNQIKNIENKKKVARLMINWESLPLNPEIILKIKSLIKLGFSGAGLLVASSFVASFFDFLFNTYLSRRLTFSDFGLISLIGSFLFIGRIPMSALTRTVTYKTAFFLGKYKFPVKEFWQHWRKLSFAISIVVTIIWLMLIPVLEKYFHTTNPVPFLLFAPVWIIGTVSAVDLGFMGGNLMYVILAIISIVFSVSKFLFSYLFVSLNRPDLVYASIPLSMFITLLIGRHFALKVKSQRKIKVHKDILIFPLKFYLNSLVIKMSEIIYYTMDIILARHFLSATEAGEYALITLVGKMIFFIGGLFSQFILPVISKEEGAHKDSTKTFYKLFFASSMASFIGYLVVGLFGFITAPFLFGDKIIPVVSLLPLFGLAMFGFQVADTIVSFEQVRNKYVFSVASLLLGIFQIIGLIKFHDNLNQYVIVMTVVGLSNFVIMLGLHFLAPYIQTATQDLKDLFSKKTLPVEPNQTPQQLKILIYNWRDVRHVWSGGAEVYVHEIAKRWVMMGHRVTLFCGNDNKSPRNEKIDGVQIIRRGGFYTVFIWAFLYYIFAFKGIFDVIIDSENGIPFFTPLYAKNKIFLLIHHVHQEVFRIRLKPPFSWAGKFLEKYLVPIIYKRAEVVTVSPSSKADILEHGLTKKEPLVIYNGVDMNIYKPGIKAKNPTVLYLGRLSKQKSLSVLIKSAKRIIKIIPKVEIIIAGDGDDKARLIQLAKSLNLIDHIKFTGKVSEQEKISLYQKAWVFVNPSLIEGWGITSIEANACGTPVVASNVAGLRDSIKNPHSGLLVPYGEVDQFAKTIIKLLIDKKTRTIMSKESIEWAKNFDWTASAKNFLQQL